MKSSQTSLTLSFQSSLSKIFPDDFHLPPSFQKASALPGEVYSFQLAYYGEARLRNLQLITTSPLKKYLQVRRVDLVPCDLPYLIWDKHMIKKSPGLYPDPLIPLENNSLEILPGQWRALWISVSIPASQKPGRYPISFQFLTEKKSLAKGTFFLTIGKALLPKPELIQTQWFHSDSLAHVYQTKVFSKTWWKRVSQFLKNASDHHINMILTPLFTPPLDTQIGGERLSVQLVRVKKVHQKYFFDFSLLKKWIGLLDLHGIKWIEFSHLFSQWGAKFAPKIHVFINGKDEKLFGWHTRATSAAYRDFLNQFLPALISFIHKNKLTERVYFHVSDEPTLAHLKTYRAAVKLVEPHLKNFKIIDALSHVDFYQHGLVKNPIPSNNHIEDFVKAKVRNLWTYYCVSQYKEVPNRFFNMPAARSRILGLLLYQYHCVGFLHWGFNFYYSQYSIKPLNPFTNTSSGYGFPSGDPFLVYPGEAGPLDSTRHEVHREGLQDLAALQLLESKIGREKVLNLIKTKVGYTPTMTHYPREASWLLQFRNKLNALLDKY